MWRKENYSHSWEKATTLEPERRVLCQEERFNRERKKLKERKSIKSEIAKTKRNLRELNSEIKSLTEELGDDWDEYYYETNPRTQFEKTSYFTQTEPVDVDILRRTISNVVENEYQGQPSETNLSRSEVSAQEITIKSEPQIGNTEDDEQRRSSMLRLSQLAGGLSTQEIRSATRNETEMSIRDLQSKSFRNSQSKSRISNISSKSLQNLNSTSSRRYPTARKTYTPSHKLDNPIPHQDKSLINLNPPTLNKTYYQKASIVCQESEEILARVFQ